MLLEPHAVETCFRVATAVNCAMTLRRRLDRRNYRVLLVLRGNTEYKKREYGGSKFDAIQPPSWLSPYSAGRTALRVIRNAHQSQMGRLRQSSGF